MTIKNFRNFLIVNFMLLKNFLLLNSLEKKFRKFFRKSEKKIFPKNEKNGHRGGGNATFFPVKSTTFHWVLTYTFYEFKITMLLEAEHGLNSLGGFFQTILLKNFSIFF